MPVAYDINVVSIFCLNFIITCQTATKNAFKSKTTLDCVHKTNTDIYIHAIAIQYTSDKIFSCVCVCNVIFYYFALQKRVVIKNVNNIKNVKNKVRNPVYEGSF